MRSVRTSRALLRGLAIAAAACLGCGSHNTITGTGHDGNGNGGGDGLFDMSAFGGDGHGRDGQGRDGSRRDSKPGDGKGCGLRTCMSAGANCGPIGDGCGGIIPCGTCTAPQTCGGGGVPSVCGGMSGCKRMTCMQLGFNCGPAGDGCGGPLDCGTCTAPQTCGGGGKAGVCGTGSGTGKDGGSICLPKTCMQLGFNCGPAGDGCGGSLNCGTCAAPQSCGGGGTPGVCGQPICKPRTCTLAGANCGLMGDGCGGVINCGSSCPGSQVCGGGGVPNVCGGGGDAGACTNLCLQQVQCDGGATTSLSGTVYAPTDCGTAAAPTGFCAPVPCPASHVCADGSACTTGSMCADGLGHGDPLYDALVYVPNGPVSAFSAGATCSSCGAAASGSPLVSALTGVDGSFKLTNVPVGSNIPVVIQLGRWRRKVVVNVNRCADNPLTPDQTRLARKQDEVYPEDNIPLIAFDTGSADPMECVLRKIGIDDSQFGDGCAGAGSCTASSGARVQFYADNGATIDGATPAANVLYDNPSVMDQYDMTIFACVGSQVDKTATEQSNVVNYTNMGGRVFATHFSYVWLYNDWPFSTTATWNVHQGNPNPDPITAYIDTTFPRGSALSQWLLQLGAATTTTSGGMMYTQIPVNQPRYDFDAVTSTEGQQWAYRNAGSPPDTPPTAPFTPMHYTFNTPVCSNASGPSCTPDPPASQCGRVVFSDFHVYAGATSGTFPGECMPNAPMTAQEKLLEFMLFDLSNCVTSDKATCTPKTCAQQGFTCGMQGDGCGNLISCGSCTSPQVCGGGGTPGVCGGGCTSKTCAQLGYDCGPAGDGCGGSLSCGTCAAPQTCGGGGKPGVCGVRPDGGGGCVPLTCAGQGIHCGPAGDGCGGSLSCGTCVSPQTCGGGGTPGVCGMPSCTPQTCALLGYNCGAAGDGCGGTLSCGTCTLPQTCGGGGKPNVCGAPIM